MHVAEQIAENEACLREYGLTPVALLGREGLLGPDFTAVHAIHITAEEIGLLARAGSTVCSCPTTERNLGDGVTRRRPAHARGHPASRWDPTARRRSIRSRMRASSNTICGSSASNAPSLTGLESRHWPRASLTAPLFTEPVRSASPPRQLGLRLLYRGSG